MARAYPDTATNRLYALCVLYLRTPSAWYLDTVTGPVMEFEPVLSGAEQTTFTDLTTMAKFGLEASLTLAEFQAIKSDLATAKTFLGIASPTAAQSNAALKSTIRVIGALLRA